MQPPSNTFTTQFHNNSAVAPQILGTNPFNMIPNSMPVQQPQLGLINPLNNFNAQLANGQNISSMPNMMPLANGFMGIPQLGYQMNGVPMFMNQCQPQAHMFGNGFTNLRPQQLNNGMILPNGQFNLQNMNHALQMQRPVPSQQVNQNHDRPNSVIFVYPQAGLVRANQAGPQLRPNHNQFVNPLAAANPISSARQQTQNFRPSVLIGPQSQESLGGSSTNGQILSPRNRTQKAYQGGYQKSQFRQVNNKKRKVGFANDHKRKGENADRAAKFVQANLTEQATEKKRSLALTYTEREIQQWRQARQRNYPTDSNIETKLATKVADSEIVEKEAKLRREQLKEILAQQAELGLEVADVPSHYLTGSEKQDAKGKPFPGKGKFDKGKKFNRRGRSNKRQRSSGKDSSDNSLIHKREPTLLQKLLSADIKKDKTRLLEALRFMAMNSFFKDWPGKPLRFPPSDTIDGLESSLKEMPDTVSVIGIGKKSETEEEEEEEGEIV